MPRPSQEVERAENVCKLSDTMFLDRKVIDRCFKHVRRVAEWLGAGRDCWFNSDDRLQIDFNSHQFRSRFILFVR